MMANENKMASERPIVFRSAMTETASGEVVWLDQVAISVVDGVIEKIEPNTPVPSGGSYVDGVAIPGMTNVHSHAFQRGFSGLTEYRTAAHDSFWTWRKLMYEFVLRLSPEDVYLIARQLYLEMLTAGYSWVGEFHYLHRTETGAAYVNPSEMSEAVLRAAADTGIGICLLPVLYQRSGFDARLANENQRRFVLNNDEYFRLIEECKDLTRDRRNASLGMAFHSLRAVSADSIRQSIRFRDSELQNCPIHIHVSEQTIEVDDCLAATGKRPVAYLMDQFEVDERWCLIHATHLDDVEIVELAKTGAAVGLCPTTEANLGDGFFPAGPYLESKGKISIGSDSHCSVDFREELRTLEYGQRLIHRQRAILGTESESVGQRIFRECATAGGAAIGVPTGKIAVGYRADLIVVNDHHPTIAGASRERLLDRLIFSNTGNPVCRRMIGGDWIDNDHLLAMMEDSQNAFVELNRRLLG